MNAFEKKKKQKTISMKLIGIEKVFHSNEIMEIITLCKSSGHINFKRLYRSKKNDAKN